MRILCFFFQAEDGIRDGHVTGVQTCALPISSLRLFLSKSGKVILASSSSLSVSVAVLPFARANVSCANCYLTSIPLDRKSTRLNSSHVAISYAVFCLQKKIGTAVFLFRRVKY